MPAPIDPSDPQTSAEEFSRARRLWHMLVGAPKSLSEASLFHRLSLIPFLAWVGLGSDGLSSSAYGPEEAFRSLGTHTYLALALAAMTAFTICIISLAYSRVIEHFPHGGGGYVVASKLLGEKIGLVSGSALLVDYVLTIAISIAASGDALFSFLPPHLHGIKLPVEVLLIVALVILNFRGVRESAIALTPIFLVFIFTHIILIGGGILRHGPQLPETLHAAKTGFSEGLSTLGAAGLIMLAIHAYSLGGGTYTGIEAVSNGLSIMREPRIQTGKRTMFYMATSLAFTAAGLLLCYLLWDVSHVEGKTLNAVLAEKFSAGMPFGSVFVIVTLFSEGALLVVAAQAGFVDGPRVLANMAIDSWAPHRFAALSERLTTENGIILMGGAALAALLYTGGAVRLLVVMYSINVFITFSLTMASMCRHYWTNRGVEKGWRSKLAIQAVGLAMCLTILAITVFEKFLEGGWITLAVTGSVIGLCLVIRRHYQAIGSALGKLHAQLADLPPEPAREVGKVDPSAPTAIVLVGAYGGVGIHTTMNVFRSFPGHFKNLVFISVGVIDSGGFKGDDAIAELRARAEETVQKYIQFAAGMGVPAEGRIGIGTDAVEEAEKLCRAAAREFAHSTFFAGKVIFQRERWWQAFLHNETAIALQKRLQWTGQTMVILPARILP